MPKRAPPPPEARQALALPQLAALIQHHRRQLGLSIEQAAGLCNLSKQAYHNLERAPEQSRSDTLFKVLAAFGIQLGHIDHPQQPST